MSDCNGADQRCVDAQKLSEALDGMQMLLGWSQKLLADALGELASSKGSGQARPAARRRAKPSQGQRKRQ